MPVLILAGENPVLAAMLALLLLAGLALLARAVSGMFPDVHIPGIGNLRSGIANAAGAALSYASGWLDQAAAPAANWLLAPFHIMSHLYDKVFRLGQSIYNNLVAGVHLAQHLYNVAVRVAWERYAAAVHFAEHIYNVAVRVAWERYAAAVHFAEHIYNLALSYAHTVATGVLHTAQHLYNLALSYAHTVATGVLHTAQHLYNVAHAEVTAAEAAAVHYAHALFEVAAADLAAGLKSAEHYAAVAASSAAAAAAGVIATDITTPLTRIWDGVIEDVVTIEGILAADLPDVGDLVRAIPRAVPTDIAGALAGVAAIDAVVMRYLRECGAPSCRSLGGLVKDLPKLFELAEGAAFLAFLAFLVRDPGAAADETISVVDPLVTDTTAAIRHLIGA